MSLTPLWGTSIAPPEFSLRRRATSQGDVRVTSEGGVRVAFVDAAQVFFPRITSEGDHRVTSQGDRRTILQGISGPQYFATANVPTDGGEGFSFQYTSAPWQPAAQGGECVFAWAFVSISWSMGATIRVSGFTDGSDAPVILGDGSVVSIIRSLITLPQAVGNYQRQTKVFAVPLARSKTLPGAAASTRFFLRGERLQVTIESTGQLGVGELILEGIEVDYEQVRKAAYPGAVDSSK